MSCLLAPLPGCTLQAFLMWPEIWRWYHFDQSNWRTTALRPWPLGGWCFSWHSGVYSSLSLAVQSARCTAIWRSQKSTPQNTLLQGTITYPFPKTDTNIVDDFPAFPIVVGYLSVPLEASFEWHPEDSDPLSKVKVPASKVDICWLIADMSRFSADPGKQMICLKNEQKIDVINLVVDSTISNTI